MTGSYSVQNSLAKTTRGPHIKSRTLKIKLVRNRFVWVETISLVCFWRKDQVVWVDLSGIANGWSWFGV